MTDPDTVERHEHVDIGFSITIKSKRGTGTRDQDEVKLSVDMEDRPTTEQLENLAGQVENVMNRRRSHDPDGDSDD